MRRLISIVFLLIVFLHANGQDGNGFAILKEKVSIVTQQKDAASLFALEKEYDAFYAEKANQTQGSKLYYALLKLHVGYQYIRQKNYPEAERTLLLVIDLSQDFDKIRLQAYSALSQCYSYWALEKEIHDNYSDAIQYSLLTISYATMAQKEERVISQYIKLGHEYTKIGDFDNAHKSLQEAEKRAGRIEDGAKYRADIAYRRAALEQKQQHHKEAIALYETAYTLYEQSDIANKQENLIATAQALSNLYRFQLFNEEKSAYWAEKAASHQRKTTETKDPSIEILRTMLSILKIQNAGQHEEAIRQYRALIQSLSAHPSYEHQGTLAECYYHCGISNLHLHAYEASIADLKQAVAYNQSAGKTEQLIECYTILSYAYYYNKELAESVAAAKQAVILAESIYDADHKKLGDCYKNLANLYAFNGDSDLAKEYLIKAVAIKEKDVRQSFSQLTSYERANYWSTAQKDIVNTQPFLLKLEEWQSQHTDALYDVQLWSKGLLLQSDIELQLLSFTSPQLQSLFTEIIKIRKTLLHHDLAEDSAHILNQQAEKIERELIISSSEEGDFLHFLDIDHSDVKKGLGANSITIEFATFKAGKDSLMTVAYMMKKEWEHVLMIPLFEERDVKPLLNTATKIQTNTTYGFGGHGHQLFTWIWQKILPYCGPKDTIYFAPSGLLHQIAIENLPYDETHTMADVYHLVRLSSTRELAMHKQPIQHTSAALYGDIAYQEMDANTMLALSTKYNDGTRSANPSRLVDLSQEFEPTAPLPGTKAEIDSIAPILKKQHIAVKVYAQQEACEESVKALSGQKRNILHISTHGFFRPDNGKNPDPMDRCGLYFAGVDKVLKDGNSALPGNVDDGILTAKEISLLDLRDADLVVLSACETGLGDISGEGVFGLQRAFKMAGARTILMTLWRVHDDATRMLMTAFYRHYGQTHDKRTAFRAAQQEVRATYQDPYYWAGFIMLD